MYRQEKKVVSSDFEEYEVPDTRDIVADAESRETYREVVACIQSMKPVYAEVLHYKFFYGMSDQEIAKALHISVENARVRIHRARKKLKAIVKEKLENGEL
jgi:RNA polymerase sigma factor (sigma-70 family)